MTCPVGLQQDIHQRAPANQCRSVMDLDSWWVHLVQVLLEEIRKQIAQVKDQFKCTRAVVSERLKKFLIGWSVNFYIISLIWFHSAVTMLRVTDGQGRQPKRQSGVSLRKMINLLEPFDAPGYNCSLHGILSTATDPQNKLNRFVILAHEQHYVISPGRGIKGRQRSSVLKRHTRHQCTRRDNIRVNKHRQWHQQYHWLSNVDSEKWMDNNFRDFSLSKESTVNRRLYILWPKVYSRLMDPMHLFNLPPTYKRKDSMAKRIIINHIRGRILQCNCKAVLSGNKSTLKGVLHLQNKIYGSSFE